MKRFPLALMLTWTLACCFAGWLPAEEAQPDEKWFDMETCEICKHMGQHPKLVYEIKWETHLLDNGILTIGIVPEAHKATMEGVHTAMQETIEKLAGGKEMELCRFCQSYGALMAAGAKVKELNTGAGMVSLITSDDPETIKKIHAHAKKTTEEYEKMLEQAK